VKWFSGSETACRLVQVGSMKKDLHGIALKIFQFCMDNGIELELDWIPRTELAKADYLKSYFRYRRLANYTRVSWFVGEHLGHTYNRLFANYYNKIVSRFVSRFWNPGCSGVDFFVQNVRGENCLVVPPVSLIPRVIHYLYPCKAIATLVVPRFWPSGSLLPHYRQESCQVYSRLQTF
jgi:hypothetical protein